MDVQVTPAKPIPAKAVIRLAQEELVTVLAQESARQGTPIREGKCLDVALKYASGHCVVQVTIEQPPEPDGQKE